MRGHHNAGRTPPCRSLQSTHGSTAGSAMMVSRSWARDPRVLIDLVVAAAVAALSVVEVASTSAEPLPGDRPADALAYALVIAASISLVWRRRAPIVVLAIVTALLMTFWF